MTGQLRRRGILTTFSRRSRTRSFLAPPGAKRERDRSRTWARARVNSSRRRHSGRSRHGRAGEGGNRTMLPGQPLTRPGGALRDSIHRSYPHFTVGITDQVGTVIESVTQTSIYPVGLSDHDVGRTGATRCFPWGQPAILLVRVN
jgi:hypothetical protein